MDNDVFLKVHSVNGESIDALHQGWIAVNSYTWGASRLGLSHSTVRYRNLSVHSFIDKATPAILQLASNGNRVKQIELSGCKAGGVKMEYYKITLFSVIVREVLITDSGGLPTVEYVFEGNSVKMQYWEQRSSGGKGAETRSGWDIKNNTSAF